MAACQASARATNIQMSLIFIAVSIYMCITDASIHVPLEDFPILALQQQIHQSRHFPVCIIFKTEDSSVKLESNLLKFWMKKEREENYSSWEIGRFHVDKTRVDKVIDPPLQLPALRCYLGFAAPFDFSGKASVKSLEKWFGKLAEKHAEQLQEATLARVNETVSRPGLTLIGFSGHQKHYEVEELLMEIQSKWADQLNVLFVHPHSPDVRVLADRYRVRTYPSAVIVKNSESTGRSPVTIRTFSPGRMTFTHLHLYLTVREFPAVKLTVQNFEGLVLELTKYYLPFIVCFYLETSQHALQHLYAMQRTIESFRDNEIDVRFGLVDVNFDTRFIMERWVRFGYKTKFPFTVLFHPQYQAGAVVAIQQTLIDDRPTVFAVWRALESQGLPFKTKEGATVDFQPWSRADPTQVSQVFEGPHGLMCSTNAHNQTDNTPRSYPLRQIQKKRQTKATKDEKIRSVQSWHEQFDSASIGSTLPRVGTLPFITEETWEGVIEKSHAPNHPFYPGHRWRGEFTKVALVIFIAADCRSCQQNMATFAELQNAVATIEGSSLYLVNCTSDPRLCQRNSVTGFPSISALRGLGWLRGDRCVSTEGGQPMTPVKMDYHGVIQVAPIMEWFSGVAAADAVKNLKFEPLSNDTTEADVRLIATLIPRSSRYLPRVSKAVMANYFYPYECLRLACERLYGQAACYVQYSGDIPRSEFSNDDLDMVVSKVSLQRSDGLTANVVQLGRTLSSVLEEESNASIHHLHRPHRYDLPLDMKCETDHAACTRHIVQFTVDHARLPVTHMTSVSFHVSNSLVFQGELPVLVALVHGDNITAESEFYATLQKVAHDLYNDIIVVTVDVDQYSAWSGQFVPRNYAAQLQDEGDIPSMYTYPRFCIIHWVDHHHAAFYPPVSTPTPAHPFSETSITRFVKRVLNEPERNMVETEHF